VSVSLDTLKPERYKRIRGIDAFELVRKNLLFASRIKRKESHWFINATISDINYDETGQIYDFAQKNGLGFFAFPYNYSICKISAKDDELAFKDTSKIINAFNELASKSGEHGDKINELVFLEAVKYLRGGYRAPCDALRHSLMVDEQGRVGPCIELSHEFDLKKNSIIDVWPKFNKGRVKDCYLKTPCFYGCTRMSGIMSRKWLSLVLYGLSHPDKAKELIRTAF
jgi:MoaA/NifB/PqqE/SkfB family radical SAM enzyme